MPDDVAITTSVEASLHEALMAEAEAQQTSPEDIVRDLIGDYVGSRSDYDTFLRRKIETARRNLKADVGLLDEDVEAEFAAIRTRAPFEA